MNKSITTQPLHHCPLPGSLFSHPPVSTISTTSPVSSQPFSTLGPKWSSSNTHSHPSSWRELPIAVRGHQLKFLQQSGEGPARAHWVLAPAEPTHPSFPSQHPDDGKGSAVQSLPYWFTDSPPCTALGSGQCLKEKTNQVFETHPPVSKCCLFGQMRGHLSVPIMD